MSGEGLSVDEREILRTAGNPATHAVLSEFDVRAVERILALRGGRDAAKVARLRELWGDDAWLAHSSMALHQIRDEILAVLDDAEGKG